MDTEPLKERNTDELRKCLLGLENKCEDGPFDELGDVSLFQWDGKDCNGLDSWLRVRGLSRAGRKHQNMSVAFDSWYIGARTSTTRGFTDYMQS